MNAEGLGHLASDGLQRIEVRGRVLEDHRDAFAPETAQLRLGDFQQRLDTHGRHGRGERIMGARNGIDVYAAGPLRAARCPTRETGVR